MGRVEAALSRVDAVRLSESADVCVTWPLPVAVSMTGKQFNWVWAECVFLCQVSTDDSGSMRAASGNEAMTRWSGNRRPRFLCARLGRNVCWVSAAVVREQTQVARFQACQSRRSRRRHSAVSPVGRIVCISGWILGVPLAMHSRSGLVPFPADLSREVPEQPPPHFERGHCAG